MLTPTHGGCGGERAGLLRMRSGRATARLWECALPLAVPVRGVHRGGGRMQRRPIESSATIQLPLQPSVLTVPLLSSCGPCEPGPNLKVTVLT